MLSVLAASLLAAAVPSEKLSSVALAAYWYKKDPARASTPLRAIPTPRRLPVPTPMAQPRPWYCPCWPWHLGHPLLCHVLLTGCLLPWMGPPRTGGHSSCHSRARSRLEPRAS